MLPQASWLSQPLSRRTVLIAGAVGGLAYPLAVPASAEPTVDKPRIHPRDDWAQGRKPVGPLRMEKPGDARFLLIHHSASPNSDSKESIPRRIRSFFDYHTGTKGWPDVAYNFFIDPYGGLWEGRQGSLVSPVKGDATGGSQGFALLCCFIGDFTTVEPTPKAMDAAVKLLAWLAATYRIDLAEGSRVKFTSRGSTLWPKGAKVKTDPIAGHSDMSKTPCPGDALYPLIKSELLPRARALVAPPTPSPESASGKPLGDSDNATPSPVVASSPAASPTAASSAPPVLAGQVCPASDRPGWLLPVGLGAAAVGAGTLGWAVRSR